MAEFSQHRYWKKEGVADGGEVSDSWTAPEPFIIKRIHLQRGNGAGLTASVFYYKVAGKVYTRPYIPATVLGPDVEVTPVLNIPITKGEKLDWTFKNLEGSTIDVLVTLEIWKP